MNEKDILKLAADHGLILDGKMNFNEMGLDFKVGFAHDESGNPWLLRIPRRSDLAEEIELEKRILELVAKTLSVQVPDWKIASPQLVAYPLLNGKPALTYDELTYEVTWNMDKESSQYVDTLAKVLVQLHQISSVEAANRGIKVMTASELKTEIIERLYLVKSELGMSQALERRYNEWLENDALWPEFTSFIHGDLYAGHILTHQDGVVSGIIDWTTAHVGDISLDFSGHATVFGEESMRSLIEAYEKYGGRTWPRLFDQALERAAAAPLAYGAFAIESKDDKHIQGAKAQLGVL